MFLSLIEIESSRIFNDNFENLHCLKIKFKQLRSLKQTTSSTHCLRD